MTGRGVGFVRLTPGWSRLAQRARQRFNPTVGRLKKDFSFEEIRLFREFDMKDTIVSLLRPELITDAATQWDLTEEAILLDDVTKLVYKFTSPQGRRILRLTHSSHRTEEEIIAELDWMNFLIQQGIPVSCPLLSKNDRLTEHYSVENSYFVATAFEYAPGHFVNWENPQEWDPALIQTLAKSREECIKLLNIMTLNT